MSLVEYQRAVMRVCFDPAPSDADLTRLGNEHVWTGVYRTMVRRRLLNMSKSAFARSAVLVEEGEWTRCFDRFLHERPPASGLIREVIASFGRFAQADDALLRGGPAQLRDTLGFELAKWQVGYAPATMPHLGEDGVREFDFEGDVVLNPTLRVLRFAHAVQSADEHGQCAAEPTALLMYRPAGNDGVRWFAVDPFATKLFETWLAGARGVADGVRTCATALGRSMDAELLGTLSDVLTLAVQRGVIIGVR